MAKPTRWKTTGKWQFDDVFALEALRPLGGGFVPWTGFALRPSALLVVINEIAFYEPRVIVELGSGNSTIFIARFLRDQGVPDARIITVDDDEQWLERVRKHLDREDLTGYVDLRFAPLTEWPAPARSAAESEADGWAFPLPERWYATEPIRSAIGEDDVDFLLVDGPRGRRTIARFPALPELMDHLPEQSTVVLDDAARPGETEIVARWSASSPFEFVTYDRCNIAVGRRA